MRTAQTNNLFARVQNDNSLYHKLEKVLSWCEPILRLKLQDKARREGLSVSAALAAIAREYFQKEADIHYSAFIEPVIERSIARHLNNRDARMIALLVRIAFDSGQTRSIVTNILGLQPDITPELLRDIIAESDKRAKSNIMKKTPQITELTQALNNWFFDANKQNREETAG